MSSTSQGMCGGPSGNEGSLQVSSEETKQIKKKVGVGLGVKGQERCWESGIL